jgi:DNA-binding transcriptional ArsR family regulator
LDDSAYILAPPVIRVRFEFVPALSALESIREMNEVERLSGFGEWVTQTFNVLPQERRALNRLIFELYAPLFFETMPPTTQYADFPAYVDAIAGRDPYQMRDEIAKELVKWVKHNHEAWNPEQGELTAERLINDESVFLQFSRESSKHDMSFDENMVREGFALLNNPPQMQSVMVEHLRWMWNEHMAAEWQRIEPLLRESVSAFEKLDYSNMTTVEAIRAVTTRDLSGMMDEKVSQIETLVFIPAAHLGPYIVKIMREATLYLIYGARLPRGTQAVSSPLNRSELLTRLNALADDTRLRILELLTRNEELCAQDIIEQLELSQSSVSRHLSQLSATGFITERRREVAKCYSLNTDRVMDTLRTLTNFLSRVPPLPPAPPAPPRAPLPPVPPVSPEL